MPLNVHSYHVDFFDRIGRDEPIERAHGDVDDALVVGSRRNAANIRVLGNVERQCAIGVADGDIVHRHVVAGVEFDVLLQNLKTTRVGLDGDDAPQFARRTLLHGVVADIGAQLDDGHIVGQNVAQNRRPERLVHVVDGELGRNALVFCVDDEFKRVEIEDILGNTRVCMHRLPAEFSHGIAWLLQKESHGTSR